MHKKATPHAMKAAPDMPRGPVIMKGASMSPEHMGEMMKSPKHPKAAKKGKKHSH